MDDFAIETEYGKTYNVDAVDYLKKYKQNNGEKVNLIFTSPPFPLNRKKKYGNLVGEEYIKWLKHLSILCVDILADDGSVVIEMGNAWDQGEPTFSTLPLESLIAFKNASNLKLCQEFIIYNPSRLPSPVEWVCKKRIRVKDAFTRIWWMSKTGMPKANNQNILVEYSTSMKKLIKRGFYNSGARPSEHNIGETSFLTNHGGAIPSNVLTVSNTVSNDRYIEYCKKNHIPLHPARMPKEIPEFFIRFLTDEGDIVLDPFSGSNTTGFIAEELKRRWISIEINSDYIEGSKGRFCNGGNK